MIVEVRVPTVGESIREVQIAQWFKREGEWVEKDQNLVELETDKATVQLAAPAAGTVVRLAAREGQILAVGDLLAQLDDALKPQAGAAATPAPAAAAPAPVAPPQPQAVGAQPQAMAAPPRLELPASGPQASVAQHALNEGRRAAELAAGTAPTFVMPAAEHALSQYGLASNQVPASGPGGRLLKEDVLQFAASQNLQPRARGGEPAAPAAPPSVVPAAVVQAPAAPAPAPIAPRPQPIVEQRSPALNEDPTGALFPADRREEVVPMTLIRRRIAQRLVDAQQQAALLTTFNEIDMSAVMELRKRFRDTFQDRYNVKLGFMSFFVKAAIEALKRFPAVNAEIRGDSIVYHNYYDVGIAVGGGRGLVVPVLRNAERMSFAEIERTIEELARRARDNQLRPEELQGGTFTISNGGIYGSLLSTPIVNPPQSGILGLHAIQDRPVARDAQVVIRPMMYLALTYDHRIIDGREAVGFLRLIKEILEEPTRLILEI